MWHLCYIGIFGTSFCFIEPFSLFCEDDEFEPFHLAPWLRVGKMKKKNCFPFCFIESLHQLQPSRPELPVQAPKLSGSPQPDAQAQLAELRLKHRDKRQKTIEELISTETSYLKDLRLIKNTYLSDIAPKVGASLCSIQVTDYKYFKGRSLKAFRSLLQTRLA